MVVYLNDIEYEICGHALKRMRWRGITKEDIQACLDNHQVSFTPKVAGWNQKVEFLLYKKGEVKPCFEPLRLWVDVKT